jgi:hypothetical protein
MAGRISNNANTTNFDYGALFRPQSTAEGILGGPIAAGFLGKKRRPRGPAQNFQQREGGQQQLLENLEGAGGNAGMWADILGNWQYTGKDLANFIENKGNRASLAFGLANSEGYQGLREIQDPTMLGLSSGLGQISSAGAKTLRESLEQLNSLGMGRNVGLTGSLRTAAEQGTAAKSAQFRSGLMQQAYQNERQRLGQLYGIEQAMTQIALGMDPSPREPGGGGATTGDWIGAGGAALSTILSVISLL